MLKGCDGFYSKREQASAFTLDSKKQLWVWWMRCGSLKNPKRLR